MRYMYVLLFLIGLLPVAYVIGYRAGVEKATVRAAESGLHAQIHILKQTEKINAQIINTGVDDIRRILREKYTIIE